MYDPRMALHRHPLDPHPENPTRILAVYNMLVDGGLIAADHESENEHQLFRIPIQPASENDIVLVHSAQHIEWVKNLPSK